MRRPGARDCAGLVAAALALAAAAPSLAAEATFRIVLHAVTDSRARTAGNETSGSLTLAPKLEGEGLGEAKAFRLRVAVARDDTGRALLPDEAEPSPWEESADGPGLGIRVASPARAAAAVTVAGTVDLWIPGRDPSARVRLPGALARPGKPLVAKALADSGLALRLAPRAKGPVGTVALAGPTAHLEKVREVRVLRADGTEVGTSGREVTSDGRSGTLEVFLSEPAPENATLVLGLLTKASVVAVPFELKEVPLP